MSEAKPLLIQEDDVWVIRIERPDGKMQEYRCTSESQAKQLLQIMTPKEQRPNGR